MSRIGLSTIKHWRNVAQLQTDYKRMEQEELQLHEEIKKLAEERQEFIAKACREQMLDEEFTPQISALYARELGVKRRLTTIERAKDDFTFSHPVRNKHYGRVLQKAFASIAR